MATEVEPMIDAHELARRLAVAENKVYRDAAAGVIPCLRVRGVLRFDWARVVAALEQPSDNGGGT